MLIVGYQVELFRMLAEEVGWGDSDYFFTCMPFTDMMEDLKSPNGSCSLTATGKDTDPLQLKTNMARVQAGRQMYHTCLKDWDA